MNKIENAFSGKKGIFPLIPCGDGSMEMTKKMMESAKKGGAAGLILCLPFSDPIVENAALQTAFARALSAGATTDRVFEMLWSIKAEIPVILQTYANVVFSYGTEKFLKACRETGVDGLYLSDVPYREKEEFAPLCRQYGISFLSSVTAGEEAADICREAEGFLIGMAEKEEREELVKTVKTYTKLPVLFPAADFTEKADGILLDTLAADLVNRYGEDAAEKFENHVRDIRTQIG